MAEDDSVPKVLEALAPVEAKPTGEDDKENLPSIEAVQKRLEELLSKHNLSEDAYIQQHMNAQMYIPLAVLARHHSLCILGDEAAIIACAKEAAQRSDKFGIDEEGGMVRPLLKPRRNTLILHGLPDVFPEDELKALFQSSPESEAFCSIKPDVNNTAFVSFKTDESAQNVALWLRSQKLQGQDIKCAIKSEHFVRSFFPASAGPTMQAPSPYMSPAQAWGYPPWMMPVSNADAWGQGEQQYMEPSMGWTDSGNWAPDGMHMGSQASMPRDMKGDGKGKSPKGKGKGRKRGALGGSFSQDSQLEVQSGSDFASPQLPPVGQEPDLDGLAEPGYTHEFRKYSRQYIIEICNAMEEIAKPESYERCESNDVALFRSTPCKDWAPLPTPMTTFTSSFFGDERRGSDGPDSEMQKSATERASRKASWGPKGKGQSESQEQEESDWGQGANDSSWWSGDKRFGKSWTDGSWDYKGSDGGYGKHWIKKEDKQKEEAERDESSGPRKMSWADKVKGVEPSDRPQKWVAKTKASEDSPNKDSGTGPATESAAAAVEANAAATDPAKGAAAKEESTPSWADKVRQGSISGK